MTLCTSFKVGSLSCHLIEGGTQQLDGGAMFGVVPKPLWQKRIAPDERNRIPLALRCLVVEHPEGLILVDTGVGNKEDEKFHDIYGIENAGIEGATQLEDALAQSGHRPEDVRWVVNTHLHFDHGGGNTRARAAGTSAGAAGAAGAVVEPELAFPEATYVVQRGELEFARWDNERIRASYFQANFEPVAEAGRWELVEGETELVPGIRLVPTPGHTPHHQSVLVVDGGETACFLGDVVPTSAHVPLPWIMGYDVEPLVTLESKRALLGEAVAGGWLVLFEHDPVVLAGRVAEGRRGLEVVEPIRLTD
jgi:glyoxylase-like metal-dependent hydrolase (beta-lactamase superfamily II)